MWNHTENFHKKNYNKYYIFFVMDALMLGVGVERVSIFFMVFLLPQKIHVDLVLEWD